MPRQKATSTMQPRTVAALAWTLWASYLLIHIAAMVLAFLARSYQEPAGTLPVLSRGLLYFASIFSFPTIGALIAVRHPRNPIGWLFLVSGLVNALGLFAEGYWRY